MKRIFPIVPILMLAGCASFSTKQTDVTNETTNGTQRTITTTAKAATFWQATSSLANWSATQTDKSQGAKVGTLNQSASETNLVEMLKLIMQLYGK